jgi:hypothetical protein
MVNQIKSNPMSMLGNYGIPQNISNDPNAVVQHLLNNGRITQAQYNNAVQRANQLKSVFGMKS